MNIKINYEGQEVEVKDNEGNAVYYVANHRYLKPLYASFNGVIYDKTEFGWKRMMRGAVSKAFYTWIEELEDAVYTKHYEKKNL